MFIVGACFGLVQAIPILLNANAAADRIEHLKSSCRRQRPHSTPQGLQRQADLTR